MYTMSGRPAAKAPYKTVCLDLYNSLEPLLMMKKENDESTRFATKHVARDVLRDKNLRRFYRCLSPGGVGADGKLGINEDEFVRRVLERELQPFLATLILIGAVITAARAFVANVVASSADIGNKLPVKQTRLKEIFFGDPVTIHHFSNNQHRFCTLTLFHDGTQMVLDDYDTQRLPYIQEREIGAGGFGTVSEVEIPYGHFVVRTGGETSFPEGSKVVARKDYRVQNHAREDFENERDLCKAILGSPNQCDNVMLSYGTIEYSSGSGFSLFMPKADYDLFEYMRHHESDNNRSIESIARHMTCAAGLARGVAHLHNGIESPGRGTLVCYHMDLKPQNVLIFHKNGEMIWKISDFGLSRIKTLHDGSSVNSASHLTVSPTQNPAGQGIYLAPESGSPRRMTRKSDVWSLGCIVSVLCVWLQRGSDGVREYARCRTEDSNNSASFYSPSVFGGVKPNPQIKQWHKMLISDERDVVIREVLKDILGYLEDKTFLINASQRPEASELKKRLEIAAIKGLRRAEQETHNQRSVDHLINKFTSIIKPHSGVSSVKGWPISFPVQGQGCRFSPDGAILAYYSSETNQIALYYGSESFPTKPGDLLIEPAPVHSHSIDIVDIGVTKNYMVIAEKANNFRFLLVSFIDARSNGPCFDYQTPIRAGAVPSIHLIAISPLGRWIACIVKGNRTRSFPGRLYIAKLKDIIRAQNESYELNDSVWRHKDLPTCTNQDANNVTSLSFSSESSIWFTVKPTRECRACVARLPYIRDDHQPLGAFESAAFKGSATDEVTSFAPYHNSNKCIIVIKGEILVIHDFDHPTLPGVEKRIKERCKIIQIVMSRDDRRILALAKPNNQYGELRLVELSVEGDHTKVDVSVIKRFDVQYLEYSLSKVQLRWLEPEHNIGTQNTTSQDSRVLVAVLAKPNEKAVFEVDVRP